MGNYSELKFYNPVYDFFSVIVFITASHYLSMCCSFIIGCAAVLVFNISVFFFRRELFRWSIVRMLVSLCIITSVFCSVRRIEDEHLREVFPIIVIAFYFMVLLIFQKRIKRIDEDKISVVNFYNEFFRLLKIFQFIFISYLIVFYVSLNLHMFEMAAERSIYFIFILVVIYEYIRVAIIRSNLKQEKWYPIVNEAGQVIGKVEERESILGKEKYLHPVVKLYAVIDKGIYLQKCPKKELISPEKWDTAINDHVLFGETIDECIDRIAKTKYGVSFGKTRPVFLFKYVIETKQEKQLAFIYYIERAEGIYPTAETIKEGKYWPVKQIMKELDSGIFTESFIKEFKALRKQQFLSEQ